MLNLQHQHNNHTTTPHMRVDPSATRRSISNTLKTLSRPIDNIQTN